MQTRASPVGFSEKNSKALVAALPWQRYNQSRLTCLDLFLLVEV